MYCEEGLSGSGRVMRRIVGDGNDRYITYVYIIIKQ